MIEIGSINMLTRIMHILLITMILTCPAMCGRGNCECAQTCEASDCCDDCNAPCEQQKSQPVNFPENSSDQPVPLTCDDCQCVCAGALVEDASQLLPVFTIIVPALDAYNGDNSIVCTLPIALNAHPGPFPVDGCANTGRTICNLHMAFRC